MAKPTNTNDDMLSVAQQAVALAKKSGASDAAARAYRVRDVSLDWRDGKVEKITESTTRGVMIQLYADGRYASVSTSDLRPEALKTFVEDSITVAKSLAADPARALPDPDLYKGQAAVDLRLEDPTYLSVSAEKGRKLAKEMEDAARAVKGSEAILSVGTSFGSNLSETFLVTSNGFSGKRRDTFFSISNGVSVKDSDGRRPEDYSFAGARHFTDLPTAASIGAQGAQRALSRLGSKKGESAAMTLAVDHRASGRLMGFLFGALQASAIQQKRSFLEGKIGEQVFSSVMTIADDPLVPKGFGSRLFDNEGIAAKVRPVIEAGVLKNFYVDNYYGRKLKMAPTSASSSNLSWKLGAKSQKEILADLKDGIIITSFIGGNSNSGTGDFSIGFNGFRVRGGVIAEPVAEMNISGNHTDFWKKLVAVGNDPYPYSSMRTPTLVFEGVSVAGA
jgi:PmbA protein